MARRSILPLFIPHWGCPNACVFCDQRRISGSPLPVSGREVRERLDAAEWDGCRDMELAFYGGSFTAIPAERQEELLAAAQPYLDRGVLASLRLSTRPDAIDDAVLARLRRYRVGTVELGAQSMIDEVLFSSGRGHTAEDTENAAKLVKAAGFSLVLQMMTGLPGSTRERDIETARRIAALRPDGVRIYPTVIVENTELCDLWRAGAYREHTVEDAVETCADILPLFEAAGIPVIRLGLNPTEELSAGVAAAGAYHPALGELIRSEVLRRRAAALLRDVPMGASVTLRVPPRQVSAMTGQHRRNLEALTAEFSLASLAVRADDAAEYGEILVDWTR